jgi:hypothetical protein
MSDDDLGNHSGDDTIIEGPTSTSKTADNDSPAEDAVTELGKSTGDEPIDNPEE